jgi:hypothetical protein
VDVALVQELPSNRLAGSAFEEDVVGHDDRCSAADLEQRLHVLDEVELLT